MTQEEEQLLLNDLCARIPYGVIINKKVGHSHQIEKLKDIGYGQRSDKVYINGYPLKNSKPYLRPLSSMTETEKEKYISYCFEQPFLQKDETPSLGSLPMCVDWLLSRHFDFRGLISMGLALEMHIEEKLK